MTEKQNIDALVDVKQALKDVITKIDMCAFEEQVLHGLPTPWEEFNKITGGLEAGELIVIGSRPSMGKTTFINNIMHYASHVSNSSVLFFSLENSMDKVVTQLLSRASRVDLEKIKKGELNNIEAEKLKEGTKDIASLNLFINDNPRITPSEIRNKIIEFQENEDESLRDIELVVIDNLQLISLPGYDGQRVNEISDIAKFFKILAREFNIPIVITSQLNRQLEQRPNKRPFLSDLRDSGVIEDVADIVCFLYRDEVYNPESPAKGITEIIVAKQRSGPLGTIKLKFENKHASFFNIATEDYLSEFDDL